MTYIPTEEIKIPNLHADTLGFTFVWKGHFLRGIFPESEFQARNYFESGFLDEVVSKGLFPKTWISEYENEMFCMIIEHEMIIPILYATEWNYMMLRDAALMVLEIAQVSKKYGYNMIDCHKLNVLFQNNHPVYVDLGSFVPNKAGSTGWRPYESFLQSYVYILRVWRDGASQIAKRTMSPGVMMKSEDYVLYCHPIYRKLPQCLRLKIKVSALRTSLAVKGTVDLPNNIVVKLIKWTVNRLMPLECQHIERLRKKVICIGSRRNKKRRTLNFNMDSDKADFVFTKIASCIRGQSVTLIDNPYDHIYSRLINNGVSKRIISIQQSEDDAEREYIKLKCNNVQISCASLPLMNGCILIRGKFPEDRLSSDYVVLTHWIVQDKPIEIHNAMVMLEVYMKFSKIGRAILFFDNYSTTLVRKISEKYKLTCQWQERGGGVCITTNESLNQ